jgi:hypothetical protein
MTTSCTLKDQRHIVGVVLERGVTLSKPSLAIVGLPPCRTRSTAANDEKEYL